MTETQDRDALMTWPTVREASHRLNVTTKTVYTLLYSGRLEGIQTRLGWLVNPASLAVCQPGRRQRISRCA